MTEPGMEAVLASLMAEHVSDDEATTGMGNPMRYCDCGGPEDVDKPPIKRGSLPAVPLKLRDPEWFLTDSHYPTRPCKRCGSREHDDCVDWCTCGTCWECTR